MALRRTGRDSGHDYSRLKAIGVGVLLGFAWGTVMWAILSREGGVRLWLYFAITTAMIGGGAAGIFGAVGARRRGEKVTPKVTVKRKDKAKPDGT
jgi:hypothetical protein